MGRGDIGSLSWLPTLLVTSHLPCHLALGLFTQVTPGEMRVVVVVVEMAEEKGAAEVVRVPELVLASLNTLTPVQLEGFSTILSPRAAELANPQLLMAQPRHCLKRPTFQVQLQGEDSVTACLGIK